jgi:flavodoxin
MKKFIFLFIFTLSFVFIFGTTANAKVLVAYFTLSGNTEKVAKLIQKAVSGDLYKIELVTPYPSEYKEQTKLAKQEINNNIFPAIKEDLKNIDEYDIVFVGSPVWWGTMSTPVRTFLNSGKLKGKTVVPFVTHGGGGADNSFSDTKKLCKGCNVIEKGWSGYSSIAIGVEKWAKNTIKDIKK